MKKIKTGMVAVLAAVALGACGQAQIAGNGPTPTDPTTSSAPPPAPPSSWWSNGGQPEGSESPAPTALTKPVARQTQAKEAAIRGCVDAFAKELQVRPETLTFKPVNFGKSVAAGGPHYYTAVGWLSGAELSGERWSICDGIKIVNGKVIQAKYPPLISIGS